MSRVEVRRKHPCLQRVRDTASDRRGDRPTPGPRDLRNDSRFALSTYIVQCCLRYASIDNDRLVDTTSCPSIMIYLRQQPKHAPRPHLITPLPPPVLTV